MRKINLSELEAKKPLAVDSKGNFLTLKDLEEAEEETPDEDDLKREKTEKKE